MPSAKQSVSLDSSELAYLPENLVPVTDEEVARKVLKLVENLEDLEGVKAVHGNYDIDEALLEAINSSIFFFGRLGPQQSNNEQSK